jgi:hypothetical protein
MGRMRWSAEAMNDARNVSSGQQAENPLDFTGHVARSGHFETNFNTRPPKIKAGRFGTRGSILSTVVTDIAGISCAARPICSD